MMPGRLHEVAGDQQQDVDDDQELPRAACPSDDLLGDRLRDALGRQHVREQQRVGDDEHQHHRDLAPRRPARAARRFMPMSR